MYKLLHSLHADAYEVDGVRETQGESHVEVIESWDELRPGGTLESR